MGNRQTTDFVCHIQQVFVARDKDTGLSRMLEKTASIVLASLRGSTYRSVRLASSLAAALLNGLFEPPVLLERQFHMNAFSRCIVYKPSFSPDC